MLGQAGVTQERHLGPCAVGLLCAGDNSVEFFLGRLGNPGDMLLRDGIPDLIELSGLGRSELAVVEVVVDFGGE